jgi:hypothetical protein
MEQMRYRFANLPMAAHEDLQELGLAYLDVVKNNMWTLRSHSLVVVLVVASEGREEKVEKMEENI